MPLSFNLPQRPSLPTLPWGTTSPKVDDNDSPSTPTPTSAPSCASQSSTSTTSAISKRLSGRSIRHTSLVVSRPSTPATSKASPLSASFGLPVEEEDDPFGLLALEKAGLQIKEAGTNQTFRSGSEAFQYRPSPNSPVWRSSMASAMSKNSRPSLDGRASVMTGRPSFAHSRQSSISEIVALPGAETDTTSLRGMSPVREAAQSRNTSPEQARKVSPGAKQARIGTGERPPPLKFQGANGYRLRKEDTSPKTRMSAVSAKIREIERQQKAREAQAKAEKEKKERPVESDLERLAREIREMADEHEEEQRRSEEEESSKSEESLTRITSKELSKSDDTLSKKEADPNDAASKSVLQLTGDDSKSYSKQASVAAPGVKSTSATNDSQKASSKDHVVSEQPQRTTNEDDEEEDDDDDDDDYDSFDDEEEPVIIGQAVQTPITLRPRNLGVQSLQARAQVVSIHTPPPPAIPSRNPRRSRNADLPEDGASTPTSPALLQDDSAAPVRAVASPDSAFTGSKATSVYSGRDNDSTSSYSLEPERDNLTDFSPDRMSQTSRGSGSMELTVSTPTKTKMTHPELPSPSKDAKPKSPRESMDSGLQNDIAVTNAAHDILEEKIEVAAVMPEIETKDSKAEPMDVKAFDDGKPHVPEIPDRRRPFSFDASASEETLNAPSIDTTVKQHEDIVAATETAEAGKTPTKHGSELEDKVQPIVIPNLPEDDKSLYEEDFS